MMMMMMTILSSEFVVVVVRFHVGWIDQYFHCLIMFVRSASKVILNGILNQMMMMYLSSL